jgi:hypothetical protein
MTGRPIEKPNDRMCGYNRDYYEKNRDKILAKKREWMREYRKRCPERSREVSRTAKQKLRDTIHMMYGDKCVICGFTDKRALTLDHINGDGNIERRKLSERGVYRDATMNYQPGKYRILCMNCQFITREGKK